MTKLQAQTARAATALVALVAMALSYHAIALSAIEAGIPGEVPRFGIFGVLAWIYPLAVDGLLVIGMVSTYVLRSARFRVRAYCWFVTGTGIAFSVLGNARGPMAWDLLTIRLVPPIALALALHLLIVLTRSERAAWVFTTIGLGALSRPEFDRFLSKIEVAPNGCWLWMGTRDRGGYGRFGTRGLTLLAHRQSYEHFIEGIGPGLTLDHLCVTAACVNPTHLEPVTFDENRARRWSRVAEQKEKVAQALGPELTTVAKAARSERGGSARARAILADARSKGEALRAPDLAAQARISESRARAVLSEKNGHAHV